MKRTILELIRGDSAVFDIPVTTDTDAVFNLTGYTMVFTARKQNKIIEKFEDNGITITNVAGGHAVLTLDPEDTSEVGRYDFDIQINNGTYVYTVSIGELNITNDVTKNVPGLS
jgi:hypothetical protein